jgi:hypothetical protein
MSFSISSPAYSFVNFNALPDTDLCCIGDVETCLPLVQNDDLQFQFFVNTDTIDTANAMESIHINNIQLLLVDGAGSTELHNWTLDDTLLFEVIRTGPTTLTYLWKNDLSSLANVLVPYDECFRLKLKVNYSGTTEEAISNCFIVKQSDCYTSVLEYTNDEDYGDFAYCSAVDFANKARLYLYPAQGKPIEDKAVYRKSSGRIRQTRSLLTKEYVITTEHYPEYIHDRISVALAHDDIAIYSSNYSGGISKSGEYQIDWVDNLCKATATFKALSTPFAIRNNNCAACEPWTYECEVLLSITSFARISTSPNTYQIDWTNSISPMSVLLETSLDGITWTIPSVVTVDTITQKVYQLDGIADHYVRLTPICNYNSTPGTPVIFYYSSEYSPTFTASFITTTSFQMNSGLSAGVLYDVSVDGGLSYVLTTQSLSNITISGLTTGTTYDIVRRMKSTNGVIQALPKQQVTTI